jgi:hypothetical protein
VSYALSGNTPNPIPETNTEAALAARVGVIEGSGFPWLDADLTVSGVSPRQSAAAADIARAVLSSSGATVTEARWVAGGKIHVRWKPSAREQSAVAYATQIRDSLKRVAREQLGPDSRIRLSYFRIEMPAGQDDLFIYPASGDEDGAASWMTPTIIGVGVLGLLGLGAATFYFARMRKNRRRRRR